jgi:alanine dehydrogenase
LFNAFQQLIYSLAVGGDANNSRIIFDSTGTALQDVAAAAIVYEKAVRKNLGVKMDFAL